MRRQSLLTRVLHGGAYAKLNRNVASRSDVEDLRLGGVGESSLVASAVRAVDVGTIANIGSGVVRELDRIILGGTGEVSDVLERLSGGAILNHGVEEVMGGCHLGNGQDNRS